MLDFINIIIYINTLATAYNITCVFSISPGVPCAILFLIRQSRGYNHSPFDCRRDISFSMYTDDEKLITNTTKQIYPKHEKSL